jgi:phosphatidylserine/phosphatidylglycerophosphate/cardiolipin synthase-like enzyme/uncharacterized membrane protein YdjX (TVP38/TMEM64 family)
MLETHELSFNILKLGQTCGVITNAPRAKLLIDAKAYYSTLWQALLNAKRSIAIVGWDIDSRTDLLAGQRGEQGPDGSPSRLKPLLTHLVKANPKLSVRLLLWDYTFLYAADREPLPTLNLNWSTPPQIEVCLDDVLPMGACHHQKLVIIDDALAFCGGLDLTQRRWDSPAHKAGDTRRTDTAGRPYEPFHDTMMMVDGEAALALAKVFHQRWRAATCDALLPIAPCGDPWPCDIAADFHDVALVIAQTAPTLPNRSEKREVEQMYCQAIATAQNSIYIENQYLTSSALRDALQARLADTPALQVVIVGPETAHGWLEAKTMGAGRHRFMHSFADKDYGDRVRLLYPQTAAEQDAPTEAIMVHSKLMVVDDRFLTIGSANLNNRSMGFDSECNLALEGQRPEHRQTIAALRNRLLAEHLDCNPQTVAEAIKAHGLIAAVDLLRRDQGRSLYPVQNDARFDDAWASTLHGFADPEQPVDMATLSMDLFQGEAASTLRRKILTGLAILTALVASLLLWQGTPLSRYTDIAALRPLFQAIAASPWTVVWVMLIYLLAGFVMFPITLLITLTAIAFPPLEAFGYAVLGILLSASTTYGVGALVGRRFVRRILGKRLNRISRAVGKRGVAAVIGLRVAPIAPYAFINMVAGASHIRFRDFTLGTIAGMTPGVIVLIWLGQSIWDVLTAPTTPQVAVFLAAMAAWIALGVGLQRLVDWGNRRQKPAEQEEA